MALETEQLNNTKHLYQKYNNYVFNARNKRFIFSGGFVAF